MAVVDELAGAGELVKGKCDQVPVAVVRGYLDRRRPDDGAGASALVREAAQDLFSLGTAEARAAGLRRRGDAAGRARRARPSRRRSGGRSGRWPAWSPPARPSPRSPTRRYAPGWHRRRCRGWPADADDGLVAAAPAPTPPDRSDLVRFGADLHRLRTALAAEGVASPLLPRHRRAARPAPALAPSDPRSAARRGTGSARRRLAGQVAAAAHRPAVQPSSIARPSGVRVCSTVLRSRG